LETPSAISERIRNAVSKYTTSIIQIAFSYTKNLHDAEDIAQDVFLAYMTKNPDLESEAHEKAWLIRVAINKSKDHVKSHWFRLRTSLPEDLGYCYHPGEGQELLQAIMELDNKYRIPIHLFYYEDYSINEIAGILGTRPSTVATWLERGRGLIRKKLGGMSDE